MRAVVMEQEDEERELASVIRADVIATIEAKTPFSRSIVTAAASHDSNPQMLPTLETKQNVAICYSTSMIEGEQRVLH